MPPRRPAHTPAARVPARWRPAVEALEDRSTPAVVATQVGEVLTVVLNSPNDAARVVGTDPGGAAFEVFDGATSVGTFAGVTTLAVSDPGANAGQAVTFEAEAGDAVILTGALTVTGVEAVTVAPAAGPLRAASVAVAGATATNLNAGVTTTAAAGQSYSGPVLIGADLTLSAGAAGLVTFGGTVNAAAGVAADLTVNAGGATNFSGAVGGSAPLASLITDAAGTTALAASVTTTGLQTYSGPTTVNVASVVLAATGGGAIAFGGTLNGRDGQANGLTVNTAGQTIFAGAVGGTVPLGSLQTDAPGSSSVAVGVRTSGSQTYGDPLTLSGTAVTLAATTNGTIFFGGAVNGATADATALAVNTGGTTTFGGSVGGTTRLRSLATDAAGSTVVGLGTGAVAFQASEAVTFADPTRLAAAAVTVAATGAAGTVTVGSTLNGTAGIATDLVVNAAGATTLTGVVGGITPLATVTTDAAGTTSVGAGVTTSGNQTFNDPVTVAPAAGVTAVSLTSNTGALTLAGTLGGESAVPVTVQAGAGLSLGGSVSFSAAGSQFTARAGTGGTGGFTIAPNVRVRADRQSFRAGDGAAGAGTGAAADLLTNAPSFRDAADAAAPLQFVFRQDAAVTDANLPALAQFGTAPPDDYKIVSDDGGAILNTATLAGPGTTALTLAGAQAVSLGVTINAPLATVRLRSTAGPVAQTGGGITASALGVQAATGITLTPAGGNAVRTLAARSTGGNVGYAAAAAYTIGVVTQDPVLDPGAVGTAGVTAALGTVTLTQSGANPLDVTVAGPLAGTTVTANGGIGDDRVTVNYTLADALAPTLANGLVFNGFGGNDTLTLTDAGNATARTYAINNGVTRATGPAVTYTSLENLSVIGGTGGDTFNVTPAKQAVSPGEPLPFEGLAGPELAIVGGPSSGTSGDAVNFTVPAGATPTFAATTGADGISGTASFSGPQNIAGSFIQNVAFSQVEAVSPQADIRVTVAPGTSSVEPGGTAVFTVVVTNTGPAAAAGVRLTELAPVGLTNATFTTTASAGASATPASGPAGTTVVGPGAISTLVIPANGTVTFTVTGTVGIGGTASLTATASAPDNALDPATANNTATASTTVTAVALTAVGAGAGGGPQVRVFNADGTDRFAFFAYDPSFTGGVTVATGDVTGDGFEDIVTGSATTASHVKVFDGRDGSLVASFFAFPGFGGGVNVAVAGGRVVAGAGLGGGPVLKGFTIAGGSATEVYSVLAYEEGFRGGVQVAGLNDLLTVGAGPGGGPRVRVFREADLAAGRGTDAAQVASFFAFPVGNADGISVGMGLQGTTPTVIAGAGPASNPTAVTFNAQTGTQVGSFQAFDAGFRGGVRVAGATTAAGGSATVVGAGPGGAPRVRVLDANRTAILDLFAFDPSFTGGVYVG